jgi:hypothetical protein
VVVVVALVGEEGLVGHLAGGKGLSSKSAGAQDGSLSSNQQAHRVQRAMCMCLDRVRGTVFAAFVGLEKARVCATPHERCVGR